MTFDTDIENYTFVKNEKTEYQSIYSPDEYDRMTAFCKKVFGRDYTNGQSVRLDGCIKEEGKTVFSLSQIHFYDFITSNFALYNMNKLLSSDEEGKKLAEKLKERYEEDGPVDNVDALLKRNYLANSLAVSCLLKDHQGRFLITKRNGKTGISNHFYSVPVTGSVDDSDFGKEDPFVSCCQREVMEELGYALDSTALRVHALVVGKKKLQPIILTDAVVDDLESVLCHASSGKDFQKENSGIAIVSKKEIRKLLSDENVQITEAARTHLESALESL